MSIGLVLQAPAQIALTLSFAYCTLNFHRGEPLLDAIKIMLGPNSLARPLTVSVKSSNVLTASGCGDMSVRQ